MKKLMYVLMLSMFLSVVASADIATIPVVRDASGATATVARMRYTGTQIDYDYPGSWMMVGDHIHGANHYSDGITKYDIPAEILPSYIINSVTIEGYFHTNVAFGGWDGTGNTYIALSKYNTDNSSIPITLADTIDGVGGGGAGSTGSDRNGGTGIANDYRSSNNDFYAGGGGAGTHDAGYGDTSGGSGGGGAGYSGQYGPGENGAVNTGGGAGGSGNGGSAASRGGNGGSGIVVIRYAV